MPGPPGSAAEASTTLAAVAAGAAGASARADAPRSAEAHISAQRRGRVLTMERLLRRAAAGSAAGRALGFRRKPRAEGSARRRRRKLPQWLTAGSPAARSGADAVLLPKVESAGAVRDAVCALEAGGAPEGLALWCMIETPRGVLAAVEIAGASPRLACLVMGTSDLVKDLGARHTPERAEVATSLGLVLLAARARGLAALDGVHLDLDDAAGFEAACRQGRDLGFDGKTLIHPRTLEAANRIFAPDEGELAEARRIVAAHAEAEAAGQGVTVLDGRLVERLHVEAAQRRLALAEAIAELGSE